MSFVFKMGMVCVCADLGRGNLHTEGFWIPETIASDALLPHLLRMLVCVCVGGGVVKLGPVGNRGCGVGKAQKGPRTSSCVGRIPTTELIVLTSQRSIIFWFSSF